MPRDDVNMTRRKLLTTLGAGVTFFSGSTVADAPVEKSPPEETSPRTSGQSVDLRQSRDEREPDHYIYISRAELERIQERVERGINPWKQAYDQLLESAQTALSIDPRSVVDDGAPKWDDPHQYGSVRDGKRHDYLAAIEMGEAARDCSLAYWFTDEDQYAERAIDLVYHWCLAPETYMNPDAEVANRDAEIELYITIPTFWYAASLVRGHPYWRGKTEDRLEERFASWVRKFITSVPDPGYYQYNNQWAWHISMLAGAGSYLNDPVLLARAFCMWRGECETEAHGKDRPRPWNQYRPRSDSRGALKRELNREDAFDYHVYGIKALTMTAEIARHYEVNLYDFNAPSDPHDGATLRKLFNFMTVYMDSPSEWQWGTGEDGLIQPELRSYAGLFELAHSRWQDNRFLDVVQSVGRPAYDTRLLGHTSLTHANLHEIRRS